MFTYHVQNFTKKMQVFCILLLMDLFPPVSDIICHQKTLTLICRWMIVLVHNAPLLSDIFYAFMLILKGVLHLWGLFLKTLCIFSKNKATLDKVSYGSGQK